MRGTNALLPDAVAVLWAHAGRRRNSTRATARARAPTAICCSIARCARRSRRGYVGWYHRAARRRARCARRAALFVGEHDFRAFRSAECQAKSPVRTLHAIDDRSRAGDRSTSSSAPTRSCTTWCATSSAALVVRRQAASSRRAGSPRCLARATAPGGADLRARGLVPRDASSTTAEAGALSGDENAHQDLRHHAHAATRAPRREAGADAIGLVFYPPSPRSSRSSARCEIRDALPPFVQPVGLFVNADAAQVRRSSGACRRRCCSSTATRRPAFCAQFGVPYVKAAQSAAGGRFARISAPFFDAPRRACSTAFVEAYGGGGESFDWSLVPRDAAASAHLVWWARRAKMSPRPSAACGPGPLTCRAASSRRKASRMPRRSPRSSAGGPRMQMYDLPDARGHFGPYGGSFVAETLTARSTSCATPTSARASDPAFKAEFRYELKHYVGRPSPIYHAKRLVASIGGAQIYLKREDLNHTGAHKINNTIGQALLARRMGKPRVIAETGAGQHGVATATICARYGLECVVYMGSEDVKRQAPNVYRMKLLGATVVPVEIGLEDAEGRAQRGDARLGHQRREHLLHHRHRRRPAPVSDDGARLPARDRRRMPGADAGADRPPARCGDRLRRRRLATRWASSIPYIDARRRAADRRRGGRRGPRQRQARGVAAAPARPACCTATAPTCCRTTNGQITETHSISAGPRLSRRRPRARLAEGHRPRRVRRRSPTTRRSRRSTTCAAPKASSRRSNRATRVAYAMKLAPTHAAGPDPARQPLRPRRQGHAHRRRARATTPSMRDQKLSSMSPHRRRPSRRSRSATSARR